MAAACANLKGYAGVDHIIVVAEGTANTEHGVFVRTVECTNSNSVFTTIVAITGCKVPLSVRVEIQRMQGRQSSCASADLINATIKVVNTMVQISNAYCILVDLIPSSIKLSTIHSI